MNALHEFVYPALDEIKASLENPARIENKPDTPLMGPDAALDSLTLVSLLVSIEGRIVDKTGKAVTLADEKAMSRKHSPFRTTQTLADYVMELLSENVNA